MLASTHLDPVVGIDIHWEMIPAPPAPPIPTPIPNPFVGMVWDPMGLAVGILINQVIGQLTGSPPTGAVIVNMLPATNTGTEATGFGHLLIPPGISWAPMPSVMPLIIPKEPPEEPDNPACPDDDAIVVTGSRTVHVMGANFARLGDMAMSCSEPVRLPSSIILAVPKGRPVLVGGPPTLDAMAAAGAFIRTQWVSHQLNNLLSHLSSARLRNLLSRVVCFLTGHPVDVATGRVFTDHIDFELPGPIPLRFERVYNSGCCERPGPLGYGWSHSLDQRVWEERGKVVHLTEDGREIEFDAFHLPGRRMQAGDELYYPIDRLTLKCLGEGRWEIWTADGIGHELGPVEGGEPGVARLLAKKTRDGHHRIELHYDERGCLSWVRDSGKRQIRFESDPAGRLIAIKLPVPRGEGHYLHSRYGYDERGDLVSVADPAGNSWEFEYAGHLLTRETDRERLSFYFGYDGIGQDAWCVRTWGDGGIYDHQLTYDKKSKVTCVTNSLGHTTTYRMDLVGTVNEVIDPHGGSTKYEYDPRSLKRTLKVDPLGNATGSRYDARGNLTRAEQPDGSTYSFDHHQGFDAPLRAVDPNGGEWRWEYDPWGRLQRRADPLGHWTRFEHEDGRLVRAIRPGGAATEIGYDASGNVSRLRAAAGAEEKFEFDRLGRLVKTVTARGGVERRERDALGNVVRVETPHGVVRMFDYDREGNLTRARDGSRDVSFVYAGFHRMHERHEAGSVVRFHYDTEDQLVAVENEAGELSRFERDARGLVSREVGFDGAARTFERDAAGRTTGLRKASGRATELTYDELGRVMDLRHEDGAFERYRYRADGSLIEASNEVAELHFERDELARVTREITRFPDGSEYWVRSGFGADGQRVRVETSDGHLHHIERDEAGQVTGVEFEHASWRVDIDRDVTGLEVSRSFSGGFRNDWERDVVGRPRRRTVTHKGGRTLDDKSYEWSGDATLTSIRDARIGETRFTHDLRGRLTGVQQPWGETQTRSFDAAGNVYKSPRADDRRYGAGGRIEASDGTVYRHDDDGNLIEKTDVLGDITRYAWNGAGRLERVELPDGRCVAFQYDALARRLSKVVRDPEEHAPTREVRWRWDAHTPLVELDSEAGKTEWVFEPGTFNPLAKMVSGRVWGVLHDHLGTPTELVSADGEVEWRSEPDAYEGAAPREASVECPFRWPGQYADEETGLHYNRYRFYDPGLGRYISQDPLGLRFLALGTGGSRDQINPYGYVADPARAIDPLGLVPLNEGGYSVYALYHPGADEPFYVGVTNDLERRVQEHLASGRAIDGETLYQEVFSDATYAEARGIEQHLIETHGTIPDLPMEERFPGNVVNSFRHERAGRAARGLTPDVRGDAFESHYQAHREAGTRCA